MSGLTDKISVRVSDTFHRRLKVAAATDGVPVGVFLERLLEQRERKLAKMPSPLHRVSSDDDD